MAVATPNKHHITVSEQDKDMTEISCSCGWAPKSLIEKQFSLAIVERHTMMNRGT